MRSKGADACRRGVGAASLYLLLAGFVACLPGAGPPLEIPDATPPPATTLGGPDAGLMRADVDLGATFAVTGLAPSHGPFTGGTRTTLSGRGFPSNLRVRIGGTLLPSTDIVASDPTHAAVITPPGTPGPADVTIEDPSTAQTATLSAGFFYDSFVLTPSSGATTGGTRVAFTGSATHWAAGTTIAIAGVPCTSVTVTDAAHMQCTTPAGSPGTDDVDVTTPDHVDTKARDAYTYSDTTDGFRGGLGGSALNGNLIVLAFDSVLGSPIPGAHAIVGSDIASAIVQSTDSAGEAQFSDPSLINAVTVTIAAKCHQPVTFVDVPVDTVTAYLGPVLEPSCGMGNPPSIGNYATTANGEIDGELVWGSGIEFQRGSWTNIPPPQRSTERAAAYVFTASGSASTPFSLPPATSATTPSSPGGVGYAYTLDAAPGNLNVYALAGIEDRSGSAPVFTAYVMGVARGVAVLPSAQITGVDIPMTTLLDQAVTFTPVLPPPGPDGPNTLFSSLAVTLDETTFAVLPNGSQTAFYPVGGNVSFIGVPALDNALVGQSYVYSGSAATGPDQLMPTSVVSLVETTNTSTPIAVGGFLSVPILQQPGISTWNGTQVAFGSASTFDLAVISVSSANGLVVWQIVAPQGNTSFNVPDLSGFPDDVGLWSGPLQTTVYVANITSFQYGQLRLGQLSPGAWNAYAGDAALGAY